MTKPAKAFTDLDRAETLGVFLDFDGDADRTAAFFDGRPSARMVQKWAREYHWDRYLEKVQERLNEDVLEETIRRKRLDLKMLEAAKGQLLQAIVGKTNEYGEIIIAPVRCRSLESASNALCKVLETEANLRGEELGGDQSQATFLTLLRSAIGEAEKTVEKVEAAREVKAIVTDTRNASEQYNEEEKPDQDVNAANDRPDRPGS